MKHAKLGTLDFGDDVWEAQTNKLRHFSKCGWNEQYVGRFLSPSYGDDGRPVNPSPDEVFAPAARPPRGPGKQSVRVTIESPDGDPSNKAQDAAIAYLLKNETRVLKAMAVAASEFVRNHDYWEWMQESLEERFPTLEKLLSRGTGWMSLVEFREIRISDKTRGGKIVVGFDCNCAWDDEHGWGVQLVEDRLVDVGYGTVGWNIYEEEPSIDHPRLGKLKGSVPFWKCDTKLLDQFIRCGWNEVEVCNRLEDARGKRSRLPRNPPLLELTPAPPENDSLRPLQLVMESENESGPTELQYRAVDYLLDNQAEILQAIGKRVGTYAKKAGILNEMEKLLGTAYADLKQLLKSPDGWLSLIFFQKARVTDTVRRGSIVIGCSCRCGWPFDFYRNTNAPYAEIGILLSEKGVLQVGEEDIIYEV